MVATSPLLRLLAVAPLLAASLSHALPSGSKSSSGDADSTLARRSDSDAAQQIVFGNIAASSSSGADRQPDFVEAMLAEAQRSGMDLKQFGIDDEEADALALDRSFTRPTTATVDLGDAAERAALMAEAAAEDALAWIQPIAMESEEAAHDALDSVKTKTQPGSGWIWNLCGSGEEAVHLDQITVKPDPPVAGQNLTVYAKGTVKNDVEKGTFADVVVKLGFIRLLSKRFDVCQLAEENDAEIKCPVKAGDYEMTHTVELPREIPPARFNVHVSGKTQADVDLMCMDLSIDFSHH